MDSGGYWRLSNGEIVWILPTFFLFGRLSQTWLTYGYGDSLVSGLCSGAPHDLTIKVWDWIAIFLVAISVLSFFAKGSIFEGDNRQLSLLACCDVSQSLWLHHRLVCHTLTKGKINFARKEWRVWLRCPGYHISFWFWFWRTKCWLISFTQFCIFLPAFSSIVIGCATSFTDVQRGQTKII